jgi:hemerythrin
MSVGVKALDEDHKRMVGMLNELHDGIMLGQAKEALGRVLDGLVNYTQTHFAREEQLFSQADYPGALAHKTEHNELTKRVMDLQMRYKNGAQLALTLETVNFLKSWLLNHIQISDKRYGPHLNAKGIH